MAHRQFTALMIATFGFDAEVLSTGQQASELQERATVPTTTPAPFDVAFSDPNRMVQRAGVVGTIERAVRLDGVLKYRRA